MNETEMQFVQRQLEAARETNEVLRRALTASAAEVARLRMLMRNHTPAVSALAARTGRSRPSPVVGRQEEYEGSTRGISGQPMPSQPGVGVIRPEDDRAHGWSPPVALQGLKMRDDEWLGADGGLDG